MDSSFPFKIHILAQETGLEMSKKKYLLLNTLSLAAGRKLKNGKITAMRVYFGCWGREEIAHYPSHKGRRTVSNQYERSLDITDNATVISIMF